VIYKPMSHNYCLSLIGSVDKIPNFQPFKFVWLSLRHILSFQSSIPFIYKIKRLHSLKIVKFIIDKIGTYTKHGHQVHGPPLWTPVHGPPLWTRSMDHLFGPSPWTPSWITPHFKRQRTRPKVSERMFKFPKFWICGPLRYRFKMYLFLTCRYLWSRLA